jgi:pyruvate dehydrogenase E1 component alpha subunit
VLRDDDRITSTHRGHGHCIAKGGRVDRMMAELFGKPEGYCRGRSGSMHIADPSVGILGATAIVGGAIPTAVGSAFTARVTGGSQVTVAFLGEGTVGEGVFHECLNLASLWQLPIIFVCENNQYAELTHVSVHLSAERVADFGAPYNIPAATVDGNDLGAVRAAAAAAVSRARDGGGPTLLEFETYRLHGHFEGDPQRYRSAEEVADRWQRDPIPRFRAELLREWPACRQALEELEADVLNEVEAAVSWAEALPDNDVSVLTEDTYHTVSTTGTGW